MTFIEMLVAVVIVVLIVRSLRRHRRQLRAEHRRQLREDRRQLRAERQALQQTKRRENSPLYFDSRLSQQEFTDIAHWIARHTPRVVGIRITGMAVILEVRSNSGLTSWTAMVDFNDYGRLTGTYWLTSENLRSEVPGYFARALQAETTKRMR